ncbi:hypothetical protein Q3G72_025055 [Acer saccharum]|nr:hypothetical protein Q3G72_025055 [Acer saccharum]
MIERKRDASYIVNGGGAMPPPVQMEEDHSLLYFVRWRRSRPPIFGRMPRSSPRWRGHWPPPPHRKRLPKEEGLSERKDYNWGEEITSKREQSEN